MGFEDRDGAAQVWPLAAFGVVLIAAAVGSNVALGNEFPGVDFWHARIVPIALRVGVAGDVYSREGRARIRAVASTLPPTTPRERVAVARNVAGDERFLGYPGIETVATPLLFAAVAPFSRGTYDGDHLAFRIAGLLSFYASVVALCLLAGYSRVATLLATGAIGLTYEPLLSELRVANVNAIQLAMIAAFLLLQRRPRPALDVASGTVLALSVLFKPNTATVAAAVVILWSGERRWRRLAFLSAGGVLGAGVGIAVSSAVLGSARPWADWLGMVPELLSSRRTLAEGNFALAGLLRQALGADLSGWLLGALLLGIGAVALAGSAGPRPPDDAQDGFRRTYLAAGLGAAAMALSARLVWLHYYVLLLPLMVLLVHPGPGGGERRTGARTLHAGACAVLAFSTGAKIALLDSGLVSLRGYAATLALATAALFGLALELLLGGERRAVSPGG